MANTAPCPHCNMQNSYSATHCIDCGAPLPWGDVAAAAKQTAAPPPPTPTPAATVATPPPQRMPASPFAPPDYAATPVAGRRFSVEQMVAFFCCALLMLGGGAFYFAGGRAPVPVINNHRYTMDQYNRLTTAMGYEACVQVMGAEGEVATTTSIGRISVVAYRWSNGDGSSCNAVFNNNLLIQKAQMGL